MLTPEPSENGQSLTLRARGWVRVLPAAFLAFWLCGWAAGEWFALGLVAGMLRDWLGPDLLTGLPARPGAAMPAGMLAFALPFLALWLTLWTVGGVAAMAQLLQLLFGHERISWGSDGLVVERRAPFLLSSKRLAVEAIRGFEVRRVGLMASLKSRDVLVTAFGTPVEREELRALLHDWWKSQGGGRPLAADDPMRVPDHEVFHDESGLPAIRPARGARRFVGVVLAALAGALLAGAVWVARADAALSVRVVAPLMMGLPGLVCAYGAVWLLAVHESWHPRAGTLARRRTAFGRTWSHEFRPLTLELRGETDSDGDTRWRLVAGGAEGEATLATSYRHLDAPYALGDWLAARTGVELVHRSQDGRIAKVG